MKIRPRVIEHNGHTITSHTQQVCLDYLIRFTDATSKEIEVFTGLDHGRISGALSNLQQKDLIYQVDEKRDGYAIYCLPRNLGDRAIRERNTLRRTCPSCGYEF